MTMLAGYKILEELHRGKNRVVYRARRQADKVPVIIKTSANAFPGAAEIAGLKREHEILQQHRLDGVAKAHGLERQQTRLLLILEDIGGEPLRRLIDSNQIDGFIPGQKDFSERFQIPQKLFGREPELAILMSAFDRVSQSAPEIMLVSGYSGIGKSALVNEVHKPIVRQRGYFIAGKFDQLKRNIPYSAVIQAFQELVRQLLTESESQIAAWKKKLPRARRQRAGHHRRDSGSRADYRRAARRSGAAAGRIAKSLSSRLSALHSGFRAKRASLGRLSR
jgi:hypothetical protein